MTLSELIELIALLIGVGAAAIAMYNYMRTNPEPRQLVMRVIAAFAAIAVVLALVVVFHNATRNSPAGQASLGELFSSSTPTSSIASTLVPTPTLIPTATFVPTDTPAPGPPGGYGTLPLYPSGSFTPNWRLDCDGCDEAILVTVSKVSVDTASDNMVWALTLYNHTADPQSARFDTFTLTDPDGVVHYVTGTVSQGAIINAGQSKELQGTFGFVPRRGGAYVLNARLEYLGPDSCCYGRDYGPQTMTF